MQSTTIYSFLICFLTFASSFIFNVNAQAIKGMDTVKDSMMMIDPISADRPDQSDGATTLEKGYFQMENGVSIEDIKPGFIYTYPSTLWKIGVSKTFELRVLTEYINITHEGLPDHDGLLPIQVGFKSKLFDQKGLIPDATVIGFLSLPGLASKQFETTYFAPSMRLAFQNDITDKLYVTYNLGAEWNGEDARPNFLYTFE
ncbi:MAG: transporter, partial [Saprospiraceae bacterium]